MTNEELQSKLSSFKGLMLDADGVWFTGHEYRAVIDGKVSIMKKRHFHDGQGLSFLRALGIKIVFATGEGEPLVSIVEKINDLPSVRSGEWASVELITDELKKDGKVPSLEAWMHKHGITWAECAYLGDDRTDLEAMQKVGLKVAPQNARRLIKKIADINLETAGGEGAVREFTELVLDARGIDEATLPAA
ncbi:HAD hydrolase family protein [Acetobacteraceae bacterium]|nr:HAD hydrolase family protein [Candidatus Parcubacteria bacterium]